MKSILMSIQPKWCELIAYGKKTIEVRKTVPKLGAPFKCYIYATQGKDILRLGDRYVKQKGKDTVHTKVCWINNLDYCSNEIINGKVIGEFVCDKIDKYCGRLTTFAETPYKNKYISPEELAKTRLTIGELNDYLEGKNGYFGNSYFWHISDLKIYDKPKELAEFKHECSGNCLITDKKIICVKVKDKRLDIWDKCDRLLPVTRPPQSWMYVKENENERV